VPQWSEALILRLEVRLGSSRGGGELRLVVPSAEIRIGDHLVAKEEQEIVGGADHSDLHSELQGLALGRETREGWRPVLALGDGQLHREIIDNSAEVFSVDSEVDIDVALGVTDRSAVAPM
jgi:hypothetical protein